LEFTLKKPNPTEGLLVSIALIAAFLHMMLYSTINDEAFLFTIKYIGIPIFAGYLSYMIYRLERQSDETSGIQKIFSSLIFAAGASILTSVIGISITLFINAHLGEQQTFLLQGKLVELRMSKGKSTTYTATVLTPSGTSMVLDLLPKQYQAIKLGDEYAEPWQVGALGIRYQKRQIVIPYAWKKYLHVD
jgi:hypothetical protein